MSPQRPDGSFGKDALPSTDPEAHLGPDVIQTGEGTAANDVADPHPSDEEHYDRNARPGGAEPPTGPRPDIGPNPHAHNGTAPPKPHNVEADGE